MKTNFIKPLAIMAVVATGMFSCAGTDDAQTNTGDMGTENTAVIETEPEVMDEPAVATNDTELLSNEEVVNYEDLFDNVENTGQYDVFTLVKMDPNFSTFAELIEMSGLEESMQMVDELTIFVPTNEAFQELDRERYQELTDPNNRAELVEFVQYHILPSKVYQESFNTTQEIDSEASEGQAQIDIDTRMNGEEVYVGGARVVKFNVEASNGIIHVVNGIVEPSEAIDPSR